MSTRFSLGLIIVILIAVGVGLLAASSQPSTIAAPSPTPTPTAIPTPQPNHIDIVANPSGSGPEAYYVALYTATGFSSTLTVRVGQKVTWVNQDNRPHSATADNGAFDSGELSPGQSYNWTPPKPGRYTYSDLSYPDMHGTIIVQP